MAGYGLHEGELDDVRLEADALRHRVDELRAEMDQSLNSQQPLTTQQMQQLLAATTWVQYADVAEDALISVVMPTLNRSQLIMRAINSVLAQTYRNFELIVIDDGSTDGTEELVQAVDDSRLTYVRIPLSRGVAQARNTGLDRARGDIIAYLDDDNIMLPLWLRAVAWAFQEFPEFEVVYGGRVHETSWTPSANSTLPQIQLEPWNRRNLERYNLIDMNVLAHRSSGNARFDETLTRLVDWDLALRLTESRDPLSLPVIACTYSMSAANRLTERSPLDEDVIAGRIRESRPLRVLAYNAMFPLITETYIYEENEALASQGAEIAFCRSYGVPSPMPIRRPLFTDLETAVNEFAPDALFVHWADFAVGQTPLLEQLGIPFGVRVHSFDYDRAALRKLLDHPLCIGVWAYPHLASLVEGVMPLPTLLLSADDIPDNAARDLVLSVSAGLPKKDWDFILRAFEQLPDVDRRIVIGVTSGHEDLPSQLALRLETMDRPPLMQVNLTRSAVFDLLSQTAVMLYTLAPGNTFGNPMSVVEALCAGCSVILPDRPEARTFAGPGARFYRNEEDVVAHVRDVLAGGPEVDAERRMNREHGRRSFTDPSLVKTFADQFAQGVDRWYRSNERVTPT